MCGRVQLPTWQELLNIARQLSASADQTKSIAWGEQARPGDMLPAFTLNHSSGGLDLASLKWGYDLPGENKLVYNARIERAQSALWRESFATQRALIPVAHFYEPHHTETQRNPNTGRTGKRQYMFTNAASGPLLLGAIYNNDRTSVVTTKPNESVRPIHHRMPLVLAFEEVDTWFGPDWQSLADRGNIALAQRPEHDQSESTKQLSLFESPIARTLPASTASSISAQAPR